jgi:ketosteroid isomerase-like protein
MKTTILLLLILAGCQRGAEESDVDALNRLQKQVDSAIIAGDTERYLTFITDDAVLMPPNGPPVTGREAIGSWNRSMSSQFRIQDYASRDDEIVVAGDWAFRRATADWTLTRTAGGAPIRDVVKFIIIYRRQADGSWKVARDIWSSNTPAP